MDFYGGGTICATLLMDNETQRSLIQVCGVLGGAVVGGLIGSIAQALRDTKSARIQALRTYHEVRRDKLTQVLLLCYQANDAIVVSEGNRQQLEHLQQAQQKGMDSVKDLVNDFAGKLSHEMADNVLQMVRKSSEDHRADTNRLVAALVDSRYAYHKIASEAIAVAGSYGAYPPGLASPGKTLAGDIQPLLAFVGAHQLTGSADSIPSDEVSKMLDLLNLDVQALLRWESDAILSVASSRPLPPTPTLDLLSKVVPNNLRKNGNK